MATTKRKSAELIDELDNVQMYIRLCQSAIGNNNYMEVYSDIECILGDINSQIQIVMDELTNMNTQEG